MTFRHDINALRAFAVIGVVLFHFSPNILPGGFSGVDVFFVISGFLMTKIICQEIEKNKFHVFSFYKRRARRIIPALSFLCICVLLFGWFNLSPFYYLELGKHVISSLTFFSNYLYWSEIGYFDASSHEKWLLHTWSLSAEWQFYIIYPLIISFLKKRYSNTHFNKIIISSTIIMFLVSLIVSILKPEAAYYFLPTRVWEMMLGGLAYIVPVHLSDKQRKYVGLVGVAFILVSYIFISPTVSWPGYAALMPTLGALFVITSNVTTNNLTNNVGVQSIGKWSYSIYLWHWPLVVSLYHFDIVNNINIFISILCSALLGCLSYNLIESRKSTILLVFIPLISSIALIFNHGYAYQVPKHIYLANLMDPKSPEYGVYTWKLLREHQYKNRFNDDTKPNLLVIGDSQAGDLMNMMAFTEVYDKYEVQSSIVSVKCGIFNVSPERYDEFIKILKITQPEMCKEQWRRVYNQDVVNQADVIIIAMNWRESVLPYIKSSSALIHKENPNAKILIAGSKSFGVNIPKEIYRAYKENLSLDNIIYEGANKPRGTNGNSKLQLMNILRNEVETIDYANYIDFKKILCSDAKNECTVTVNDKPIFYDTAHTTKEGNLFLSKHIYKIMKDSKIL